MGKLQAKVKFILIFLLLILVTFTLRSPTVDSYVHYGGINRYRLIGASTAKYWNPALNNVVIKGRTYNFNNIYNNAMSNWNSATVLNIPRGGLSDHAIRLHHASYPDKPGLYGYAEMYVNGKPAGNCDICIPNQNYDEGRVFVNHDMIGSAPVNGGQPLNNLQLLSLMLHEIGHVLGLDHENRRPAVMNTCTYGCLIETRPTTDDQDGVNVLYY